MEYFREKAERVSINFSLCNANVLFSIIQEKGLLSRGREIERENICTFVLNSAMDSFEPMSSMDF